jgi:PIN domain nuclease of toxin-antitoxin system
MNVLLDTHLLLWAAAAPAQMPRAAAELLGRDDYAFHFSAIAIWEIAIKRGRQRPDFTFDPGEMRDGFLQRGVREVPVSSEHALALLELPQLHRDPFDRMLIAQARVERMVLLTSDRRLAAYGSPVKVV